jgi:hypothetical protein
MTTAQRQQAARILLPELLKAIRTNRSNPAARAYVREAILRVRQMRGILELRAGL